MFNRASRGRYERDTYRAAILGVIGFGESADISRILYQSMLKAPSSPDERAIMLARKLDSAQGAVDAAIWASGSGEKGVEALQPRVHRLIEQRRRR